MWRAVHRRQLHRLGKRAGLRAHRLPGGRSAGRQQFLREQARGFRWLGHAFLRWRTDALRNRRPARLSAAGCGLRLHPGHPGAGRQRSRCRTRRQGSAANRQLQGQRHLSGRFPLHRQLPDRRYRRGEKSPARQPGNHQQDRGNIRRTRLGRLPGSQHRTARQRSHLRPPRPAPGHP
ncbi:hypothetical protein FQZ97_832810 [compost metagenome]